MLSIAERMDNPMPAGKSEPSDTSSGHPPRGGLRAWRNQTRRARVFGLAAAESEDETTVGQVIDGQRALQIKSSASTQPADLPQERLSVRDAAGQHLRITG